MSRLLTALQFLAIVVIGWVLVLGIPYGLYRLAVVCMKAAR